MGATAYPSRGIRWHIGVSNEVDDHLNELRRQSASALNWVANLTDAQKGTPQVCWTIGWRHDLYKIPVDDEVVQKAASGANRELMATGLPLSDPPLELWSLGGEIFERSLPTAEWLEDRLAVLPELLEHHGLWIQGWAYEPRDIQPLHNWVPQAWSYREDDFDAQKH